MQIHKEIERDEIRDRMTDDTIPAFEIDIRMSDEKRGTYIYDDTEENVIRVRIDPSDRFDLVQQVNTILNNMRTYHSAVKAGCLKCSEEVIVSGVVGNDHYIDEFKCPSCGEDKLINLDKE